MLSLYLKECGWLTNAADHAVKYGSARTKAVKCHVCFVNIVVLSFTSLSAHVLLSASPTKPDGQTALAMFLYERSTNAQFLVDDLIGILANALQKNVHGVGELVKEAVDRLSNS